MRPDIAIALKRDTPAFLHVDGGSYMGIAIARQAMGLCIERARTNGCSFAAIANANHFGIAAHYTLQAVEAGMVGIAMSNAPASTGADRRPRAEARHESLRGRRARGAPGAMLPFGWAKG